MWGPKQTIQTTPTQVSDRTWATHFCSHINSLKECKIFHIFHFYNLKWFWNYKFVFLNIKCRNQRDKLPFPPACVWHRNSTVSRLNVYVTLLFSLFSYFRLRWKLCCDVYCVFYTKKEPVFPTLKILVGKFKFQERQPSARTTAFNSVEGFLTYVISWLPQGIMCRACFINKIATLWWDPRRKVPYQLNWIGILKSWIKILKVKFTDW